MNLRFCFQGLVILACNKAPSNPGRVNPMTNITPKQKGDLDLFFLLLLFSNFFHHSQRKQLSLGFTPKSSWLCKHFHY